MLKKVETGHKPTNALRPQVGYRALSPFDDLDRLMSSITRGRWPRSFSEDWSFWPELEMGPQRPVPRVDVVEKDDAVEVTAELPGVKKGELDVSVSDDILTICGSTRHEENEEKGEYYHREIRQGEFSRTLALPAGVDGEQAKAAFENGVLKITLPKLEKAKRTSSKVK